MTRTQLAAKPLIYIQYPEGYFNKVNLKWKQENIKNRVFYAVCKTFDLTKEQIINPSRFRERVDARRIAIKLIKSRTTLKDSQIARIFNRDRTTVIHSIETFEQIIQTDSTFRERFNTALKLLNS